MRIEDVESGDLRILSRAEATLHPVRLRIILTLQGRQMTTREIRRFLPGIPQATLYRHINKLYEAGVIKMADQRQVHGTVERTWTLVREETHIRPEDFAEITPDELTQMFSTFVGGILELFDRYAHSPQRDLRADCVAFYGEMVHLTPEEAAETRDRLRDIVQEFSARQSGEGKSRRLLAVFSIPDVAGGSAREAGEDADEEEPVEGCDR